MNTNELIDALRKIDPDGTSEVWVGIHLNAEGYVMDAASDLEWNHHLVVIRGQMDGT